MKKSGLWTVAILVFSGVILGTLGTWSVPLGHGISAFWPAFVVQVAGSAWFGGWGVLAAVLFPICTNALANVGWSGILGFIPANLAQGLIPAWAFRHFHVDPTILERKALIFYAIWGAIIPAFAGGMIGSVAVILFGNATWSEYPLLVVRWSVPNMVVSLLVGIPIMRELTPLWRDLGILVKGWWVFERISDQAYPQRFQDMPIQLKLVLAMGSAGLGPLLILSLLELIQNGGKSATGSMMPLLLSISIVTLVLAVGFLSQETVRPLQELREQVESLMQYRNKELKIERTDEIGQLGQAFAFLLYDWRRAEASLQASEEKYRTLFEHLPIPVFTKNREGEYTSCNVENEKYWAVDPVGRTDTEFLDHESAASLREIDLRVMETGEALTIEERLPNTPMGERQVLSRKVPLRDGSGNIVGILGASVDITERKQAEEQLIESEAKLSVIFNSSRDAIGVSKKGIHTLVNPAYARMFGYENQDELIDVSILDLIAPESRPAIIKNLRLRAQGETAPIFYETIAMRRDGTKFPMEVNVSVYGFKGELYTLVVLRDITERKRAETALHEANAVLEESQSIASLGSYVFDASTGIWTSSPALDVVFGINDRAFPRTMDDWLSIVHPDEQATMRGYLLDDVIGRKGPFDKDYRIVRANDGTERWVHGLGHLTLDSQGQVIRMIGTIQDITERKKKDEEITAHQAELQRLLQEANQSRRALLSALEDQQLVQQELRSRLAEMEAINHISTALRIARTSDEMLPLLLDETLAALESEAGSILLYKPEDGELHSVAARGWFEAIKGMSLTSGESIAGTVFTSGQAHLSREFASDPFTHPVSVGDIPKGWGGMCVPIHSAEEIAGVMFVSMLSPREIKLEQIKLLNSLAEMAGTALHRLCLHEETQRRLEYLQALRTIDQAITTNFDSQVTIGILLEQIMAKLRVDAAGLLLFRAYTSTLEYHAGRGFYTRNYEQSNLRLGEGVAGRAALERNLIQSSSLSENFSPARIALSKDEGFEVHVVIPLVAKGALKGVLEIFHRKSLQPDAEWLGFLEALAGQTAIAIDNFQLFEGLQRSNMELVQAYDATIEGWSRALDLRDKETEGHTRRVTELTLELAQKMEVPDREIVHIRRGALLHDIGKMGIPDHVLHKPDKLTPEEWEIMRQHATYAYEMLYPIQYLKPALDIPQYHHEKWDGTGYPHKLKGEEIPLAARIFAIVDVWDALTNDRPYRRAWSEKDALEYIHQQSGKHFDPKVVESFLGLLNLPPET